MSYIPLHRSILDWEWYGDLPVRVLFIHILLSVRYADGQWQGRTIQAGQLPTSLPKLATETGLSEQQVRTALKKLVSTGEITDHSTNLNRLITVENWSKWNFKTTGEQQASNRRATGRQQANNSTLIREEGKKGRTTPEGVGENAGPLFDPVTGNGQEPPDTGAAPPNTDRRDPDVQAVIDYLLDRLRAKDIAQSLDVDRIGKNGKSLDGNRTQAANLLRKLAKDYPDHAAIESARRLIDYATSQPFHAPKCTKVAYLYRNLGTLVGEARAAKNTKPKTHADLASGVEQILRAKYGQ